MKTPTRMQRSLARLLSMTPEATLSITARATAAWAGPNIWTACLAPLMVTLLKSSVSGLAGRFGVTTASRVEKPSLSLDSAWAKALPAGPDFDPMIRSMWAISLPSPTSDSPMKKSAAIPASIVALLVKERENLAKHTQLDGAKSEPALERRGGGGHVVPRAGG